MKKILLFAATLFLITTGKIFAQRTCASYEHLQEQLASNPQFAKKFRESEKKIDQYVQQKAGQEARTATVTIPLVIHVVYNTAEQNISDAQVQSQVDVLNADFDARNSDYNNYDAGYGTVKGDFNIQFCVAQITHVQTSKRSFAANDGVKKTRQGGDDAIDPEHALNIWVCNLGQGLLGYAQFPGGPANTFGVVCHYRAFGEGSSYDLYPAYNLGRTTTHEIGHCFGLRHIWGDARCGNDLVGDTPLHNDANFGCPGEGHRSTCTGTPLEMWMNYMDYTDDPCMYFFSDGQVARGNGYLDSDPQLLTIANSTACGGHGNNKVTTAVSRNGESFIEKSGTRIYPSITSGHVNIEFNAERSGLTQINIYNQAGVLVMKQQLVTVEGSNTKQMDVSRLMNGVYIMQVNESNRRSVQKLIVQH